MTAPIIVVVVLVAIGAVALLVRRRRHAVSPGDHQRPVATSNGHTPTASAESPSLVDVLGPATAPGSPVPGLGVGVRVSHEGIDYVVRGELRFDEEGYIWSEYHLDAGDGQRTWLAVDLTDGTDVALWHAVELPGPASLGTEVVHAGVTYRKVETGVAAFTSFGTTGLPAAGRCWYVDYQSPAGDRRLGFERWAPDGAWEVSVGQVVPAHTLDVTAATADETSIADA